METELTRQSALCKHNHIHAMERQGGNGISEGSALYKHNHILPVERQVVMGLARHLYFERIITYKLTKNAICDVMRFIYNSNI